MFVSTSEYWVTTDNEKLDFDSIHNWITNSYWANGRTKEAMKKVMDNSLNFGLFHNDKQVGFARVITDYHTFSYLCDVIIDEDYRGRGLGKLLMKEVLEYPPLITMKRWLLFTKDAHGLYEQFGFSKDDMPERTMVKKNPDVR
ncbi:MAG: GNAT family N-acetyltransferase [Ignavibacteria bacterium]|nr:GNAT family N-acetyltransferase [Ignavibacteria bacterium]